MAPFEWLALVYFAAFAAAGVLSGSPHWQPRSRWRATLVATLAGCLVIVARFATPWGIRVWLPHTYLVLGYWIPALFTQETDERFERWLARTDARLRRLWRRELPTSNSQLPKVSSESGLGVGNWELGIARDLFELTYLLCYPLVPTAFAVVFSVGDERDIIRFWIGVLIAGYACYGTLAWTAARPPRLVLLPAKAGSYDKAEAESHHKSVASGFGRKTTLARLNALLLARLSHGHNTFPSGHVAVSLAAALAVCAVWFELGVGFLAVATGVAVAAVAGRYHYLIDVLVGVVVGSLARTLALIGDW